MRRGPVPSSNFPNLSPFDSQRTSEVKCKMQSIQTCTMCTWWILMGKEHHLCLLLLSCSSQLPGFHCNSCHPRNLVQLENLISYETLGNVEWRLGLLGVLTIFTYILNQTLSQTHNLTCRQ